MLKSNFNSIILNLDIKKNRKLQNKKKSIIKKYIKNNQINYRKKNK